MIELKKFFINVISVSDTYKTSGLHAGEIFRFIDTAVTLVSRHLGINQNGRVRSTFLSTTRLAIICSGRLPDSTHFIRGVAASNTLVPIPPRQWNIPGTMYRRKKSLSSFPFFQRPFVILTPIIGFNCGSAQPNT